MMTVMRYGLVIMLLMPRWATAQGSQDVHLIGGQQWSTRNLNVISFSNGDPIPEARNELEWKRAARLKQPAWCHYGNEPGNDGAYGKLYNWYAVNDPRGLAPAGWHIPTKPELNSLVHYLDDHYVKKMGMDSLFAVHHVQSDEDSFHVLEGGYRLTSGAFQSIGRYGFWWGTTCYLSTHSWYKELRTGSGFQVFPLFHLGDGFSVRCIKDP